MENGLRAICKNSLNFFRSLQYVPVRTRYHADKIEKGPIIRNFGYKEKIFKEGFLPRLKDANPLKMKEYRPKNVWSEKRALFGQNDYIDILGSGVLHPVQVSYNVPMWLRGVKGNEMRLLIRKKNALSRGKFPYENPKRWEDMNKRIRWLYKFLNRKTKTGFMRD